MALTYPLEQVRTLIQAGDLTTVPKKYQVFGGTAGRILFIACEDERGVQFLYQGCFAVLETVAVSNFLYFYTNNWVKDFLAVKLYMSPTTLSLTSSSVAAALNIFITEPLWKANTVLKTLPAGEARKNSLISVLSTLIHKEGLKSLWNGTKVSLWLISNPIIQFSVYEYLKRQVVRRRRSVSSLHAFLIGALSKAVATLVTYPLQIAQTRLRVEKGKKSMRDILTQLYAEKGINGLFHGCDAKMTQTVLTAAFMFLFYERIHDLLNRTVRGKR